MIRIIKGNAPAALTTKGTAQTALDHAEYNTHKADYNSGNKKFDAKPGIYNSDAVRNALLGLQHGKCCYCETKDVRSNSDVEHFRPKRAYSETNGGASKYPGYFWLAYDWDNLFLSCQVCNQIFKNDFFPIADEAKRAQSNSLSIANEEPVLVHPSADVPEIHIAYRESVPYGLTQRGQKTIEYLGFGKVDPAIKYSAKQKARIELLVEDRRNYYNIIKQLYLIVKIFESKINLDAEEQGSYLASKTLLEEAQQPNAKWSAMITIAVRNEFKTF